MFRISMQNISSYETSNGSSITACSISQCGNYLAFNSDAVTLKIISLIPIRFGILDNNEMNLNDALSCLWENKLSSQIRCMSFGQGDVDKNRLPHRSKKRRISYRDIHNACILAVGLKSGEIKVYSLIPSIIFGGSLPLIENGGNAKVILHDHYEDIATLSFSYDGTLCLASASIDGKMRLWDMWDDGNMYQLIKMASFKPSCVTWGNRSKHICIVGAMGKGFVFESEKPCSQIANLNSGHFNDISACRYSSDDSLLITCSFDTSVLIWCAVNYKPLHQIWQTGSKPSLIFMGGQHGYNVRDLQIFQDCLHLVSVSDDNFVRIWNLEESENPIAKIYVPFNGRKLIMNFLRFFPDGRKFIVGTNDGRLIFFNGIQGPASLATLCRKSIRAQLVYKLHSFLSSDVQSQKKFLDFDILHSDELSLLEKQCSKYNFSFDFESKMLAKNASMDIFIEYLPIPKMLKIYLLYGLYNANLAQNSGPRPVGGYFKARHMSIV